MMPLMTKKTECCRETALTGLYRSALLGDRNGLMAAIAALFQLAVEEVEEEVDLLL
jgi:hypothetical protein